MEHPRFRNRLPNSWSKPHSAPKSPRLMHSPPMDYGRRMQRRNVPPIFGTKWICPSLATGNITASEPIPSGILRHRRPGLIILATSIVDGENTVTRLRIDVIRLTTQISTLPLKLSRPKSTTPPHSTRPTVRLMSKLGQVCFGTRHPPLRPTDILVLAIMIWVVPEIISSSTCPSLPLDNIPSASATLRAAPASMAIESCSC